MDTIALPPRSNAITFDEETLQDIQAALDDLPRGRAVVVGDAQDTDAKARDRAKKVKAALAEEPYNVVVKAHGVASEGKFIPAVSLPLAS